MVLLESAHIVFVLIWAPLLPFSLAVYGPRSTFQCKIAASLQHYPIIGNNLVLKDFMLFFRLTNILKKKSVALAAFTFFVAMSGAFVAGNDAGMVYGTYPKMGNDWIPSDYWDQQLSKVRNMFENSTAVQFNHRTFAHLLILGVTSCWFMGRKGLFYHFKNYLMRV